MGCVGGVVGRAEKVLPSFAFISVFLSVFGRL